MGLSDLMVGANHLAAQGGGFEPQRNNNGLFIVYGLGDGVVSGGPVQVLTLSLESFKIPTQSNEVISLAFLNADRKVAGRKRLEGFDTRYKDMVDRGTAATLWSWRNQVISPRSEAIGLARNYKKSAAIVLFGPDGAGKRTFECQGVWPSSMDQQSIEMNGNDKLLIDMTFQIDTFWPADINWNGVAISDPLGVARVSLPSVVLG